MFEPTTSSLKEILQVALVGSATQGEIAGTADLYDRSGVIEKIQRLTTTPQLACAGKRLHCHPSCQSVRSGKYRIIYRLAGDSIAVVHVGRRDASKNSDVYRELEDVLHPRQGASKQTAYRRCA